MMRMNDEHFFKLLTKLRLSQRVTTQEAIKDIEEDYKLSKQNLRYV